MHNCIVLIFLSIPDTDGACISSLFERCDTTQFPGIVFGAGAKKRYIVQEGNTRHWIGFYDVSNPGTKKLE